MTRSFATWLDLETASDWELAREFDREAEGLAYDLKVCGSGYPSPRKRSIAAIAREQVRREGRGRPMSRGEREDIEDGFCDPRYDW